MSKHNDTMAHQAFNTGGPFEANALTLCPNGTHGIMQFSDGSRLLVELKDATQRTVQE